jgi:hypothetical protein
MASIQCTDVQARPTEFLDFTSLTLDEFPQLVRLLKPRTRRIWRRGASMGNRGPPAGSRCTRTVLCRRRKIACSSFLPSNSR